MVFNEHTMQERLPSATYKQLMRTTGDLRAAQSEVARTLLPMP